jgi:hypothetical protein
MTGVNTASGFYVQLSFLQNLTGNRLAFGDHALSRTATFNLTLASTQPTVDHKLLSVVMASRTFLLDGRRVAMVYYPSGQPSVIIGTNRYLSEPTYFLIDIVTGQVCGEFNWAAASMEWARTEYPTVNADTFPYGPFCFCVGHVFIDGFSLDAHVSVAYQAQAVNETFFVNDIFGNGTRLTSTIGFEDIKFGGLGQAVEYADELLMPGPLATSFTGYDFGENNLLLAPEQPTTSVGTFGGSGLTLLGVYNYIMVFERTLPNGDRVRSSVSVPTNIVTLVGGQNQITLSGYPLHMTTYSDVIVSIYRNIMVAGAPGTTHYKITDDLNPVFNDTTAQTFTYVDHATDASISVNEILYTDLGFVNRIPCPPFSVGCVFENRQFVVGPDGALWFSGEKSEGDAIWFTNNPNFRQALPTNDPVRQLVPLDGRIGIICERSVWAVTGGGYPGPDGLGGNLQTPQKLPFIGGGTGFSAAFPGGALYSSSSPGETYVLTRGLESVQIGANATDDLNGRTIVGITVDNKQRIYFGLAEDSNPAAIEVYDQLVKAWFQYLPPTEVFLLHNVRSALAYADHNSVWVQDDSLSRDVSQLSMGSPIPPFLLSDYQTEFIALGGIKDFQQIWDQIISGTYEGSHVLTVTTVTDINGELVTTVYTFTPDASGTYVYSLPPRVTECSRVSFRFQDSFGDLAQAATGNTFSIEAISLDVVTDSGLARLEIPKVIEQESAPVTGVVTGSSALVTTLRLNGGSEIKVLPGQTTFAFPSVLAVGDTFNIVKKSGPGTVVNGTGIVGNPQLTTPTLSL